jgi:hypothetical protein
MKPIPNLPKNFNNIIKYDSLKKFKIMKKEITKEKKISREASLEYVSEKEKCII